MSERVARAYVDLLRRTADVPEHVIAGILATGRDAVPALIALLGDRSADAPDAPARGHARPHAAELLGLIGHRDAVEPLLEACCAERARAELVSACATALARIGAVTDAAARLADGRSKPERLTLAMVVANGRQHTPAGRALLEALLPEEPDLVLKLVAAYGDPALAPAVGALLLASRDDLRRASEAASTLAALGVRHPKLNQLIAMRIELEGLEAGQALLDQLAPDLARLAR